MEGQQVRRLAVAARAEELNCHPWIVELIEPSWQPLEDRQLGSLRASQLAKRIPPQVPGLIGGNEVGWGHKAYRNGRRLGTESRGRRHGLRVPLLPA